ncbi:ABC transporter substrate-binding protein [Halorubrum sp. HHNYT27]|uniref:ABC transporter substrate-binding protein n=1 Tax=Halorubrum sp. HHNYT27 TaxID=3402275 RepID=UPI003EBB77A0
MPADTDAAATKLARYLATQLQRVGIGATVVPMSREELLRSVLLDHDFEMYVYRLPLQRDPDFLRPLFHSRNAPDSGWQNPFGSDDRSLDKLLERQRTENGAARSSTVREIQAHLVENQSFTPVAVPESAWASRPDRVALPDDVPPRRVSSYLAARPVDSDSTTINSTTANSTTANSTTATSTPETRLRMALTDPRSTANLNPLSPSFRADRTIVRLIYDSLGRPCNGTVRPWMASSWTWHDGDSNALDIDLREDIEWHDGALINASDVAFTFEFLSDTALGSLDQPVPAPRYRGRTSLVDGITTQSPKELTLEFGDVDEAVAKRALSVPILPRHVWKQYARPTNVASLDDGNRTEALDRQNLEPIGSGPLRVTEAAPGESLSMEPFESHFLSTGSVGESVAEFDGGFSFDALDFTVLPSDGATVELLSNDTVDASANSLSPGPAEKAREDAELAVETGDPQWCYHVGYNHRKRPFDDADFRRAVARLVDRSSLVDRLFDGEATGVVSPLETTQYAPEGDEWDDTVAELRYLSERGSDSLDVKRAKSMFWEAGYPYSADGELLIDE